MASEKALSALNVGDVIYTEVVIDKADWAGSSSTSGTAKKVAKGDPVKRLCVVLTTGAASVEVTYLATFAFSNKLPSTFADKDKWYPISPNVKEGAYDPLPAPSSGHEGWVSLRAKHTITKAKVEFKAAAAFSADSVAKILAAI